MEFEDIIKAIGIKPYYRDPSADIAIYCGDCREILPLIPDHYVDLVLTSPPYNKNIKYAGNFDDDRPLEEFQNWTREWLNMCYLTLAESSRSYIFCGDAMHYWLKPLCEEIGWQFHETLTWCKPNLCAGYAKRITGDWNIMTEFILALRKGKRIPMLKGSVEIGTWNWFVIPTPQTNFIDNKRLHPAQFPAKLILSMIARTPAVLILDPFLGSGTTAVCAKKLGRKCIGIEINSDYCHIAADRLRQAVMRLE